MKSRKALLTVEWAGVNTPFETNCDGPIAVFWPDEKIAASAQDKHTATMMRSNFCLAIPTHLQRKILRAPAEGIEKNGVAETAGCAIDAIGPFAVL